jgi:tRNA dimethylallyltransferase
VVALFGATALGKTEVAIELARRLGGEIVVADSMQVYRGLAIVTNQPDAGQRRRAAHHLVGVVPPQAEFSVAQYATAAHEVIDGLLAQGVPVLVEGGSGLYLRAALGGLDFAAPPDEAVRREFEERWAGDPGGVLDELRSSDPAAVARLDTANPRRVLRALEAARAGRSPGAEDELWAPGARYEHRLVALLPDEDREELRLRVDDRVDAMLAAGALDEVGRALEAGPFSRTASQAIGVRELLAHLQGDLTLDEAAAGMKRRTRALVRRQLTWLRKLPAPARVAASGRPPDAVAERVLDFLRLDAW